MRQNDKDVKNEERDRRKKKKKKAERKIALPASEIQDKLIRMWEIVFLKFIV